MNNILNNNQKIKDRSKGQKIVAAVYLVTNHLSDIDPLKTALRSEVLSLLTSTEELLSQKILILNDLLQAATFAGLVSEKNTSIIAYEAKKFGEISHHFPELDHSFFAIAGAIHPQKSSLLKRTNNVFSENTRNSNKMSFSEHVSVLNTKINKEIKEKKGSKSERGESIMSFMTNKKSATIKDITALFPDVSEKTIQRELGSLVASGKLTKRGNKRWSIYLLAGSP